MRFGLIFAGKILVDIRRLIAVEAEEGFKRDIVTIAFHIGTAFRTIFRRQIEARSDSTVRDEFAMLAIRAGVVRYKWIDLGDASHSRNKGRTD